jgi:tRNA pseudouridine55 synthase
MSDVKLSLTPAGGPKTNGFLVIDKPSGWTSHDIVAKVRKATGVKKIGHAGTLDPMATGVLVLCLGHATRLSEYVMASTKQYDAVLRLGLETDTYDADGRVTAEYPIDGITEQRVTAALAPFRGAIAQVPPMYSAIQKNGKRLYDLARAGVEIEREPRPVTIYRLELTRWNLPYCALDVECSPGTYIRSLAHDLGQALGCGAHLTALRRGRSGALADPVDWQTLQKAFKEESWERLIVDEHTALGHIPTVALDSLGAMMFMRGQQVIAAEVQRASAGSNWPNGSEVRVYGPEDRFIGIGEIKANRLQPIKVFA